MSVSAFTARRRRSASRAVAAPREWSGLRPRDIWIAITAVGIVLFAMWLRHGGPGLDPLTAFGQVSALGGTYAALLGVLFASRAPWLDQVMGSDRLRAIHGVLGFVAVWAIGAHALTSTLAAGGGSPARFLPTLGEFLATVPGMLGAVVGMALLAVVGALSTRFARRRMSYERWHGIHLYVYLAVVLGYLHQLTIGSDFVDDPLAAAFWIGLYVVAFTPLVLHRILWPIVTTIRHRPRVRSVVREADGVFSLYVVGRDLDRLAARSGQFFVVRALTWADWTHGHPFSISAAPRGDWLRFTIKILGEGTRALAGLAPGTRLALEGPYGSVHGARRTGRPLLLIGGGIGIAPIRALAESLGFRPGEADLIYRVRDGGDAALRAELEALAARRGIRLHVLASRRADRAVGSDPLSPDRIRQLVPDAAQRDIFLCGPEGLMERTRAALLALGAAPQRIHLEQFG